MMREIDTARAASVRARGALFTAVPFGRLLLPALLALFLTSCAGQTTVYEVDLSRRAGIFVLGFTTDESLRSVVEDRLVADLRERGFVAFASREDLPVLSESTADTVVAAAEARAALGVLLVNRVAVDASDSVLENPARITPKHPDLEAFYRESRGEMVDVGEDEEPAFAEVNLFLLDDDGAQLYWSGTTWFFTARGREASVGELGTMVSEQLRIVADQFGRATPAPE